MQITDDRKEVVFFRSIAVTDLLESLKNDGSIYMKLTPVVSPEQMYCRAYNAVNVTTGRYTIFDEDEVVVPVRGSFHREGYIND